MSLAIAFSKLCVSSIIRNIQRQSQQSIHLTPIVFGEPMKKRKRIDPQVIKARLDRRKRKLEKQIRRLQKNARQFKPIDEIEIPKSLSAPKDRSARVRPKVPLSEEQLESRAMLQKDWTRYQKVQTGELYNVCLKLLKSQEKALLELRNESEQLYQAAIQPDDSMFPLEVKGPVYTAPIKNYISPDGDYKDVSRKWE